MLWFIEMQGRRVNDNKQSVAWEATQGSEEVPSPNSCTFYFFRFILSYLIYFTKFTTMYLIFGKVFFVGWWCVCRVEKQRSHEKYIRKDGKFKCREPVPCFSGRITSHSRE